MNNGREVKCRAAADVFRSVASLLEAAGQFYKAGQPENGEALIKVAMTVIESVPEGFFE